MMKAKSGHDLRNFFADFLPRLLAAEGHAEAFVAAKVVEVAKVDEVEKETEAGLRLAPAVNLRNLAININKDVVLTMQETANFSDFAI